MAEDDADFRSLLNKENGDGHDSLPPPSSSSLVPPSSHVSQDSMDGGDCKAVEEVSCAGPDDGSLVGGGRWDKSLGVLCQKFIMLFLVTPVRIYFYFSILFVASLMTAFILCG